MRKTKIIATVGPASANEETLGRMFSAGMNVARLNFSHGTHEQHRENIELIKRVREKMGLPIAIMLDTKGPEYRIKSFRGGSVMLSEGDEFVFSGEDVIGDAGRVSVDFEGLSELVAKGDRVLANNGLVAFQVLEVRGPDVVCRVVIGGELSDRKSLHFPNKIPNRPYISNSDRADILFGIENGVDFIAASFVSRKSDVAAVRALLDENGGADVNLIAKIENRAGVDNIDEICEIADGVMVARGDLGVEIPFAEVPSVQKHLIRRCRLLGKRVITATEMLESMIHNPRPTRAEISDVANAVYDGSSAVMLSGESAVGQYPAEAVAAMAEVARYTEEHIDYRKIFLAEDWRIKNTQDAVSHAACAMAIDVGARCIAVNSISGMTARLVSRYRAPMDIIGITTSERAQRQLNMSWGVIPVLSEPYSSVDVMFYRALIEARRVMELRGGERVVLTGGLINGRPGNTNTIRVETVAGGGI